MPQSRSVGSLSSQQTIECLYFLNSFNCALISCIYWNVAVAVELTIYFPTWNKKKNTHSMCIAWACIRLPHTIVAATRIAWDCPRLNMRRSINSRTVMSFRMNENVLATSTHTLHTQREGETDKSSHRCGQHHHHRRRRFLQNPCRLHRPTDHIETNVTFFIWWRHNGIVSTNGQHLWLWLCEYCSGDWHSCFLAAPRFLVS